MFNNPYKYTDPTGLFSVLDALKIIVAAVIIYATAGAAAPYFAAFMAGGAGAGAALATGMAIVAGGGFAAGLFATGTLKGGIRGAFSAVLTAGIGVAGLDAAGQVLAQAASGGIMESLQGGNFGHGFVTAGVTALLMPRVGNIQNDVVRTMTGAIVGGTLSEATGGKFANGAVSGAIQAAMAGIGRRGAHKGESSGGNPLPNDEAAATMKQGVSIFQRMRADGVMDGMELYDDIGALNNAHPGAFIFRYDGVKTFYSDGTEIVASADIFEYGGITVHRVNSLDEVMDTVFHEVAHLDPQMAKLWRQSTPGIGTISPYPNLGIQQQVHSQIEISVNQLMEVYRAKYKP